MHSSTVLSLLVTMNTGEGRLAIKLDISFSTHYCFQVALRVRPINEDEIIYGATPIIHKVDKQVSVTVTRGAAFN